MIDRNESLRDQIATIVQAGYSQRKTSVETADEIIQQLSLVPTLLMRNANGERRLLEQLADCYFNERCEGMLELMMRADRITRPDKEGEK